MPVTMLGDVMGTMYCLLIVCKYTHGQNIDPNWLEGFGFGTRIQLQLPYHIQCMSYLHLILHVT